MISLLCVIFQIWCVVVEGGVTSGSAEALANRRMNKNGGAAGNTANTGGQTGVQPNVEPVLARLIQLGGSLFIQPVGQAPVQQLLPIGALQQGTVLLLGQTGGATGNPPGQMAQTGTGGPVTLFAVLPQRHTGGAQQGALLTPGHVQLIPLSVLNNQQQAGAAVGQAAGRLRFQRSLAARLRGIQKAPGSTEIADEDDEDGSAIENEDIQEN
ncbi:hypothetical protein NQZ68_039075 [Xyrichtys novacula]|uniref:Uncharacterized protein n=1 Tax=Xyrichtys novacula TaxID=13765 RepID=A0AAV1EUY1_XYRNO|nr:hypothetical protein NQZ68_039075 [Xyrichtys novacula]